MFKIEAIEQAEFQFDRRYFFFCMHSAVSQLLHFYRVPNAELMIYTGWSCWLASDGTLRLDQDPLTKGRRDLYRMTCCQAPEEYPLLWQKNLDSLSQGRPVILGVDYFYLPFHPRYRQQHGAHAVLLYGAHARRQSVWIADYNSPFVAFRGELPARNLRCARQSSNAWNGGINSGGHLQAACLELFIDGENLPQGGLDDLSQTLWSIDRDYFEPSGEGIRGVRAVEHLLRHWEDCEQRDTPGNALWLHGQLLPLCEKKALFSHYLGDAAPLMAKASSRLFAMDTLDKINETWTTFLKILLKIAYTPHDYRPLLCAARELCENVLELERRFSSLVKQLYRELRA